MPAGPMTEFVVCLAAHAVLARAVPSPWWVPDLTLVGLVLAVARTPSRWLLLSAIAGLFAMGWAVRFPAQIFLSYVAVGAGARLLGRHWDATDLRVQMGLLGLSSVLLNLAGLWLSDLWSFALLGLSLVRMTLTVLAVPCVRLLSPPHGTTA